MLMQGLTGINKASATQGLTGVSSHPHSASLTQPLFLHASSAVGPSRCQPARTSMPPDQRACRGPAAAPTALEVLQHALDVIGVHDGQSGAQAVAGGADATQAFSGLQHGRAVVLQDVEDELAHLLQGWLGWLGWLTAVGKGRQWCCRMSLRTTWVGWGI